MTMRALVVNLNLAVDKTAEVDRFEKGRIYRMSAVKSLPGGKGVNVARALTTLGLKPRLTGFVAGHTGKWISQALRRERLASACVEFSPGESRICFAIVDSRDGVATDFNEEGSPVPVEAQRRFFKIYEDCLSSCGIVALSGRMCPGLREDSFAKLIAIAKKRGIASVLDTTGQPLKAGAYAGPTMLKINREEFEYLSDERFSPRSLCRFFKKVSPRGTEYILVTDGPNPGWGVTLQNLWRLHPPKIKPVSAVGAGDSFTAGLIYGYARAKDRQECARLALGAAASDCMSLGAGIINKKQCLDFARKAALERLPIL